MYCAEIVRDASDTHVLLMKTTTTTTTTNPKHLFASAATASSLTHPRLSLWPPCLSVPSRRFVRLQTRRYFVSAMLKIVFGHHSFSYCAPKQWNFLPCDNHHIQSSHAFKTASKNKTKQLYTTGDFKFSFTPSSLSFPVTFLLCARARVCGLQGIEYYV